MEIIRYGDGDYEFMEYSTWEDLDAYLKTPEGIMRSSEREHSYRKGYWQGLLAAVEIARGGDARQLESYANGPAYKWYCGDPTHIIPPPKCEPWKDIRKRILERDKHKCCYCGEPATHVDHIIPVCDDGSYEDDNLVAACEHCNLKKHRKDWTDRLYMDIHNVTNPPNRAKITREGL